MSNIFVTHRKLTDKIMLQALNLFHELLCDRRIFVCHRVELIVTGSDVIPDDVTRCWDYRRERPNFSRSVRFISLCIVIVFPITHRVTRRM